ncbi:MAG: hypothetical protein COV47_01945 [Candidatus Diapherotrites archaeon CG11_big_fil_rev_8_21_14_0_20_37_9]|nr:MAG: hypothetical protein COV47_01945 [Candidatus Diapherotrites archaeon CG11_big_fil_rev_8_21_14_0_20_37_9]
MDKIHFSRPPTLKEIETALKQGTREIYISQSSSERMSKRTQKKIKESGITINIEKVAGRPINMSLQKILEIVELHKDHRTYREIEQITGIPKSTVHYIIKYAQRQKIKKGKKIVYL